MVIVNCFYDEEKEQWYFEEETESRVPEKTANQGESDEDSDNDFSCTYSFEGLWGALIQDAWRLQESGENHLHFLTMAYNRSNPKIKKKMEVQSVDFLQEACLNGRIPIRVLSSLPPTWLPPLFCLVSNALQRSKGEWDAFEQEMYRNGSSFLSVVQEMNAWNEDHRNVDDEEELLERAGETFMSWFGKKRAREKRLFDKLKREGITQSTCCHLFSECEVEMVLKDDQDNPNWMAFQKCYQSLPE